MIARLRGRVVALEPDAAILEAGGVGYHVQCHLRTLAALHEAGDAEVTLHVHTSVSADAIRLYGFMRRDELRLFRLLIGVERIGPKAALSILGRAELTTMVRAIREGDVALMATVPGIGRKTAERVVLELRDRLGELALVPEPAAPSAAARLAEAAIAGLVGLGFREAEARSAVRAAAAPGEDGDIAGLVGRALRLLDTAEARR
ncbi:MAG TPA: Holliday junction branch migration protein RuvA [Candidatus Binatia bacterium]|nr:Holliday junction branch migration protein RuvA [Candidatus Binatia bacterium]